MHIAVLWALAVAQPLFDLLGRNPEFFATRGLAARATSSRSPLLVTFAVPAGADSSLEWLAGLASEAVGLGHAPRLRGGAGRR